MSVSPMRQRVRSHKRSIYAIWGTLADGRLIWVGAVVDLKTARTIADGGAFTEDGETAVSCHVVEYAASRADLPLFYDATGEPRVPDSVLVAAGQQPPNGRVAKLRGREIVWRPGAQPGGAGQTLAVVAQDEGVTP